SWTAAIRALANPSAIRVPCLCLPFLLIHFLLISCLLIFTVITKPSSDPHGLMATIAAMIAVTAMGCQFALLRLALPVAPSTAVMTGNLTNAVLALVDLSSRTQPLLKDDSKRLSGALNLLVGFFLGRVAEVEAGESPGGWRPTMLTLRAAGPIALGVSITPTCTTIATSDLAGRVIDQEEFLTDAHKTLGQVIDVVRQFTERYKGSIEG